MTELDRTLSYFENLMFALCDMDMGHLADKVLELQEQMLEEVEGE